MRVQGNFAFLLAALIGLLLWAALAMELDATLGHGTLIQVAFEVTLLAGLWSLAHDRRLLAIGVTLALIGVAAAVSRAFWEYPLFEIAGLTTALLFYLLTLKIAFRQLFTGPVDANNIMGAICIYLLVGLCWSLLFYFNLLIDPQALSGLDSVQGAEQIYPLIYFSFVTLSTLGYGDITPVSPFARFLAYTEALFGQFYIAVLVAGFVAGHVSRQQERQRSD